MVLRLSTIGCALLALTSCISGPRLDAPDGFLQLRETPTDYKATTADGARLWARQFEDRDEGTLAFWADALEHDLIRNRGYELIDRTPTANAAGLEGVLQRYRVHTDGAPHGYLIAVFADHGTIRTVEFLAPSAVYDAHEDAVRTAITTLR